jgi:hypothetical protein
MKTLLPATFALALLSGLLCAQEESIPPKHLRLIPLGEAPELEEGPLSPNGIRTFKEPPPGSFIPRPLALQTGETRKPLYFGLLHFTPVITVPGEVARLEIRETKTNNVWLSQNAPNHPLTLGVLYRDPETMSWNNPKLIFLKDDAASFPTKNARFVNTTGKPVYFRMGKAALWDAHPHRHSSDVPPIETVPPGETVIKALDPGENVVWIGADNEREIKQSGFGPNQYVDYWRNKIFLEEDERLNFFFYKSQMKNPRLPFLMHKKTEKIPRP